MKKHLFMLTGWSVGKTPLEALADALRELNYAVTLSDLPNHDDPQQWLLSLGWQLPPSSYWIGWSLGGQLLSQLTSKHADRCLGLVTLASNPRFTSCDGWSEAMPPTVLEHFRKGFQAQPEQIRHRFAQLVARGCNDPRQLSRFLQQLPATLGEGQLNAGLDLLASLDARSALQTFSGPQYHLLADADALIPPGCAAALQTLLPAARVERLENNGHGFPVQSCAQVAQRIDHFIRQTA